MTRTAESRSRIRRAYFDESIHDQDLYIVGAFVLAPGDIEDRLRIGFESMGLRPGVDEFKSSATIRKSPEQVLLRKMLAAEISRSCRVIATIHQRSRRSSVGVEALAMLNRVAGHGLAGRLKSVHFDEGVGWKGCDFNKPLEEFPWLHGLTLELSCCSKERVGVQLADLVSKSIALVIRGQLPGRERTHIAGKNSGYDPELLVPLGWSSLMGLRHALVGISTIPGPGEELTDERFVKEVYPHGLWIDEGLPLNVKTAAKMAFGRVWMGCIH